MGKRNRIPSKTLESGQNTKQWSPKFVNNKCKGADRLFSEAVKEFNNRRGLVPFFLQPLPGPVPSLQVERATEFFSEAERGSIAYLPAKRAWIDNRYKSNEQSLCHPSRMNTLQVIKTLEQQWHEITSQSDIHRLLIQVLYLTRDYALALIQTVSERNAGALRAAIIGHIARDTTFRVVIPARGFLTFRLELHLPYLTLRRFREAILEPEHGISGQYKKPWDDLPFLRSGRGANDLSGYKVIYDAHATIVISGWDRSEFIGYAFLDPGSSPHHSQEDAEDEEEDETEDSDDSEDVPFEDRFVSYGWYEFLGADDTIWDPRVYFLLAVRIRVGLVLQEYNYLVGHLETDIEAWNERHLGRQPQQQYTQNLSDEDLLRFSTHIRKLLQRVREYLSATTETWHKFSSPHGDIAFFLDVEDQAAKLALGDIRDTFRHVVSLEKKITSMIKSCDIYAKDLRSRTELKNVLLSLENNRFNQQALECFVDTSRLSKRTTEIAAVSLKAAEETSRISRVSVYLVLATTPFVITLQYFTSERKLFAFNRTPRTFFVSISIIMPLLLMLALILYGLDRIKDVLFWKLYEKMGGKKPRMRTFGFFDLDDNSESPCSGGSSRSNDA